MDQLALEIRRQGAFGRDAGVAAQLAAKLGRVTGCSRWWLGHRGQRQFGRIMQVPVFLRGAKRKVRLGEAQADEERGAGALLGFRQPADRFRGKQAVRVSFIRDVRNFKSGSVGSLAPRRRTVLRRLIHASLPWGKMGHIPRGGILAIAMSQLEDFPHRLTD